MLTGGRFYFEGVKMHPALQKFQPQSTNQHRPPVLGLFQARPTIFRLDLSAIPSFRHLDPHLHRQAAHGNEEKTSLFCY